MIKKIFNGGTTRKSFFLLTTGPLLFISFQFPSFLDITVNFIIFISYFMILCKRRLNDANIDITEPRMHSRLNMILLLSKKSYPYENKFGRKPKF